MINSVYLETDRLDDQVSRFLTSVKGLGFSAITNTAQTKGSFAGKKVTVGKPTGYKTILEFLIKGTSINDYATQRDIFNALIGGIVSAGSKTLKINRANGADLQIPVVSAIITGDLKAQEPFASNVLVEMLTEYPYLVSQTLQSTDVNIYQGGGMAIPMALPMDMSSGGANEVTLTNGGSFEAYPVFTFAGALSSPTLYNATTGKILNVNMDIAAGEYLVIDTFNRTVYFYSGSPTAVNKREVITGDFWTLAIGDNKVRLGNPSYNASAYCKVEFRNHYIGI